MSVVLTGLYPSYPKYPPPRLVLGILSLPTPHQYLTRPLAVWWVIQPTSLIRSITMFSAFGLAFIQLFTSVTILFKAFTSFCNMLNNITTVGEEKSKEYLDTARSERQAALRIINADPLTAITKD